MNFFVLTCGVMHLYFFLVHVYNGYILKKKEGNTGILIAQIILLSCQLVYNDMGRDTPSRVQERKANQTCVEKVLDDPDALSREALINTCFKSSD